MLQTPNEPIKNDPSVQHSSSDVPPPIAIAPAGANINPVQCPLAVIPKKKSFFKKILSRIGLILFLISILLNIYLMGILAASFGGDFKKQTVRDGSFDQVVAIYSISGFIGNDTSERFSVFFDNIAKDDNVKAVVIRVETGGGGLSASDQLHNFVKRLRTDAGKKVIVSMGGIAASGGYYLSAPADEIFAEPTTTTGSIGVISMWPVVNEGLKKLGIDVVVMKSKRAAEWKDEISFLHKPDNLQREHLQRSLDAAQERFDTIVKDGRGSKLKIKKNTLKKNIGTEENPKFISITEDAPLNGKVYSASEAMDFGLVDKIGYLSDAVDRAVELAGLGDPKIVRYERRKGMMESVMGAKSRGISIDANLINELQTPKIMAIWKVE